MNKRQVERVGRILHRADIAARTDRTAKAALVGCDRCASAIGTIRNLPGVEGGTAWQQRLHWRRAAVVLKWPQQRVLPSHIAEHHPAHGAIGRRLDEIATERVQRRSVTDKHAAAVKNGNVTNELRPAHHE